MILYRVASPLDLWYWRLSFMTVSTASEPDETKKVEPRSPGAISASLCASSSDLGCWKLQLGKNPSSFICLAATSASSDLPCPTCVVKSPASPSYVGPALVVGDVAALA